MQQDNSSYTVTSPDIMLTDDGISIFISSTNQDFIADIKALYEKYVDTSIVFNVQQIPTSEQSISWVWYVSQPVDVMIIDLDTCAWVDVCAALLKKQDDNHHVVFYSEKNKKRDIVRLINATSEYLILKNIDMFDNYLKVQLGIS
jgi:DNA-binding NarL/FixJ family response regulator